MGVGLAGQHVRDIFYRCAPRFTQVGFALGSNVVWIL